MVQDQIQNMLKDYQPILHIKEDEYLYEIKNLNHNSLLIEVNDEITISYDLWHCHYPLEDSEDLNQAIEKVKRILTNQDCIVNIYCNNQLLGSGSESYSGEYTKEKVLEFIHTFFSSIKKTPIQKFGVTVKICYWDESLNNEIKISQEDICKFTAQE